MGRLICFGGKNKEKQIHTKIIILNCKCFGVGRIVLCGTEKIERWFQRKAFTMKTQSE